MDISILVGCRNNLDYTKLFYDTTRKQYPEVEIVFVSLGSNDGTKEWFESLNDPNTITYHNDESSCLSDTYNKAFSLATKSYMLLAHNDMVLGPNFLEELSYYKNEDIVLNYLTVEPPVFEDHERPGKMINDFGFDFKSFRKKDFELFCIDHQIGKTEPGISFFMMFHRKILEKVIGFDPLFSPMFKEDDDLILRILDSGIKDAFTVNNAMCYHFVSKTSRFSEEYIKTTNEIEQYSTLNFVRKWGFLADVIGSNKLNIVLATNTLSGETIYYAESNFDAVYSPFDCNEYVDAIQKHTKINLKNKFRLISELNFEEHDIILVVSKDTEESKKYITDPKPVFAHLLSLLNSEKDVKLPLKLELDDPYNYIIVNRYVKYPVPQIWN